jgi:hypothetical protein
MKHAWSPIQRVTAAHTPRFPSFHAELKRQLMITHALAPLPSTQMKQHVVMDEVDRFFSAKGPPRLFMYFMPPQEALAKGCCVSKPLGQLRAAAAAVAERKNSLTTDSEGHDAAAGEDDQLWDQGEGRM